MNILYKNRYDKLIDHYKKNLAEGFVEKHHIIPKCMQGSDDLINLILLPTRAHFIAHYLLYRAYPENRKLAHAFAMMGVCNNYQHRSSRLYEKSKLARSKALTGIPRPEWIKEKLRKPKSTTENYKKPKTKDHSSKISLALKGKTKTETAVQNSIKAKQDYFNRLKSNTEKITNDYRNMFLESKLTRKEFYLKHTELSISTLKRYLRGL
jgi:hypothetical protein